LTGVQSHQMSQAIDENGKKATIKHKFDKL
jgi:hypothetical protein